MYVLCTMWLHVSSVLMSDQYYTAAVIHTKGNDVTGAVVAIHNVPGEGDVGAVLVGLEVADMLVLASCSAM